MPSLPNEIKLSFFFLLFAVDLSKHCLFSLWQRLRIILLGSVQITNCSFCWDIYFKVDFDLHINKALSLIVGTSFIWLVKLCLCNLN